MTGGDVTDELKHSVHYTAEDGPLFGYKQAIYTGLPLDFVGCYPFRGAPDVTIKRRVISQLMGGDQGSDGYSSDESRTVENSNAMPPQTSSMPKQLGEVIAGMHVCLAQKVLRMFLVKKKKPTDTEVVTSGLLIHKSVGATLCILHVPISHGGGDVPMLEVDAAACRSLTSSCFCYHLKRLLGEDMIVHPC